MVRQSPAVSNIQPLNFEMFAQPRFLQLSSFQLPTEIANNDGTTRGEEHRAGMIAAAPTPCKIRWAGPWPRTRSRRCRNSSLDQPSPFFSSYAIMDQDLCMGWWE